MASNEHVPPSGDHAAAVEAMRARFAIATAIDYELRAASARIIGLNPGVTEELFLIRCKLAFVDAKKKIDSIAEKVR